ncbi:MULTISPECIES: ribosome maturation factor RimP [Thiomicrorhabdus]|uniref:Ribosome maturation factor RimP n=1 Tax=Thiomicrorhabdus heinhorstiae TaxID=2748010 RepID=A0ABS0BSY4_9GAMM|nr:MULTISPECIES: ribosome maturation factor RimP [Thiomicrorhabdus]MBF6056962.1 ribosome maturation factor RimP [Thiomicrorhabdus heinhorstiae]
MTLEEKLENSLRPTIESMGFEFWGIEYMPAGRHSTLRVYVDREDSGITVDDCADISHQVSAILDVEDPISGAYNLEVSSPGMDRTLFRPEQYQRYQGQTVQVRTSTTVLGRKRFKGPMVSVDESKIGVEVDGELYEIPFDLIEKANLVAEF